MPTIPIKYSKTLKLFFDLTKDLKSSLSGMYCLSSMCSIFIFFSLTLNFLINSQKIEVSISPRFLKKFCPAVAAAA
jgi:hypothetical protein